MIFSIFSLNPFRPSICVKNIALVFLFIAFFNTFSLIAKFSKLISINTGLKLEYSTDVISDTQVTVGTIISPSS